MYVCIEREREREQKKHLNEINKEMANAEDRKLAAIEQQMKNTSRLLPFGNQNMYSSAKSSELAETSGTQVDLVQKSLTMEELQPNSHTSNMEPRQE